MVVEVEVGGGADSSHGIFQASSALPVSDERIIPVGRMFPTANLHPPGGGQTVEQNECPNAAVF